MNLNNKIRPRERVIIYSTPLVAENEKKKRRNAGDRPFRDLFGKTRTTGRKYITAELMDGADTRLSSTA